MRRDHLLSAAFLCLFVGAVAVWVIFVAGCATGPSLDPRDPARYQKPVPAHFPDPSK